MSKVYSSPFVLNVTKAAFGTKQIDESFQSQNTQKPVVLSLPLSHAVNCDDLTRTVNPPESGSIDGIIATYQPLCDDTIVATLIVSKVNKPIPAPLGYLTEDDSIEENDPNNPETDEAGTPAADENPAIAEIPVAIKEHSLIQLYYNPTAHTGRIRHYVTDDDLVLLSDPDYANPDPSNPPLPLGVRKPISRRDLLDNK